MNSVYGYARTAYTRYIHTGHGRDRSRQRDMDEEERKRFLAGIIRETERVSHHYPGAEPRKFDSGRQNSTSSVALNSLIREAVKPSTAGQ